MCGDCNQYFGNELELFLNRDSAEAMFRFDEPLESPSLRWLCFRGNHFEPFMPPPIGREATIKFDGRAMLLPKTGSPDSGL